ncbi:MAG: hypothetical protein IIB67_11910 [Proteobacteria bacterium]|nr:hypothetical protein [Pseudomonadota bacterium]
MQFLIVAHDGTDAGAPARRLAVREAHIEGAKAMAQSGVMICGGALLDDHGAMTGSACIVEFEDRAALDAWLNTDPYVTGDVWRTIEVTPFRRAV